MRVRSARPAELAAVMNVLDGADLEIAAATVDRGIDAERVLVAETGTIVGALVAAPRSDGAHVEAIAVRPGRRGQGIGEALIDSAVDRWGRLTASFDPELAAFYEAVGFTNSPAGERCFGEREEIEG